MKSYRLRIATAVSSAALAVWVSSPTLARATPDIETQVKPPLPKQTRVDAPPLRNEAAAVSSSEGNDSRPSPSRGDDVHRRDAAGGSAATEPAEVQVAPDDAMERGIRAIAGQPVRGADGRGLGSVHDFVVDLRSGEIAYVVVASGGVFGAGSALRLVPWNSIERGAARDGFTTQLSMEQWGGLPIVTKQELKAGRLERNMAVPRPAGETDAVASRAAGAAQSSEQSDRSEAGTLIRAGDLRGKTLRADEQGVGTIKEIVIDFDTGTAAALVDVASHFTGATENFLVPFSRLALEAPLSRDPINTTLARTEFKRAESTDGSTAQTESAISRSGTGEETPELRDARQTSPSDESLAPTGRTVSSPPQSSAAISDQLATSVEAVKQALRNDPVLAETRIEVVPENGRVVLRGTVRNQLVKGAVENAATHAISPASVDSQIRVEER